MSLFLGKHEHVQVSCPKKDSIIKSVKAYVIGNKELEEKAGGGADCHAQSSGHWIVDTPISTPMSVYDIYKSSRKSWGIDAIGSMIVEVELNNGIKGHGISIGGIPGCYIVEKHFARFIEGEEIYNIELIWDEMYKASVNYGRKGLVIQVISAVDLALWDCLGKYKKEPVYNLIGGKVKNKLPIYATTVRPDIAQSLGFFGAKIPLPYGPSDGNKGLEANIERLKQCCNSIKPNNQYNETNPYSIMIDCYMSLNVPYVLQLLNRINQEIIQNDKYKHINIKWIEEYLPPDNYQGYQQIYQYVKSNANLSGIMLTCGEHEYTRYGFRRLLETNCVDVLQPDITWLGGITEAKKVISLAAAYDVAVIPHGSSVYSYHIQIAYANCPMAEFLMLAPNADEIQPLFGNLFIDEPLPKNGYIELDENKYGFGVTLNPDLDLVRPFTHQILNIQQIIQDKQSKVQNQKEWLKKHSLGPAKLGKL